MFNSYKNKNITFVEIGIANGGSLEIWKKYFGKSSRIIGIDINPECRIFEKDGYEIFIGNQSCPKFWKFFFKKVGNVDIILDDGGHTNLDQIITTLNTVNKINDNGLLVIEDTHTSYSKEYNSSTKYSFVNFAKAYFALVKRESIPTTAIAKVTIRLYFVPTNGIFFIGSKKRS